MKHEHLVDTVSLYSPSYEKFMFVSNDLKDGDNMVELSDSLYERGYLNIIFAEKSVDVEKPTAVANSVRGMCCGSHMHTLFLFEYYIESFAN